MHSHNGKKLITRSAQNGETLVVIVMALITGGMSEPKIYQSYHHSETECLCSKSTSYIKLCHAPGYLANNCQLVTEARAKPPCSADTKTLTVHPTSNCFGDRTFVSAAKKLDVRLTKSRAIILPVQEVAEVTFI